MGNNQGGGVAQGVTRRMSLLELGVIKKRLFKAFFVI